MRVLYWCKENFHIALLLVVIIGFGGFAAYRSHIRSVQEKQDLAERRSAQKKLDELRVRQAAWPEILVEPVQEGKPPPVPEMPTANQPDWFRERLRVLVQNHPKESVHKNMNEAVLSGQLMLNTQTGLMTVAEFKVIKRSDVLESTWKMDTREILPLFAFDPQRLASLKNPQEIREAMLVVYHENVHYEQWLARDEKERNVATYGMEITPGNAKKACTYMWEVERDAYEHECRVAIDWGMGYFMSGLCKKVSNPAAFSQFLFWIMGNPENPPSEICRSDWARLAGHPYPEAFIEP